MKEDEVGGLCSTHGRDGNTEKKKSLWRPRCRWEGNIRM